MGSFTAAMATFNDPPAETNPAQPNRADSMLVIIFAQLVAVVADSSQFMAQRGQAVSSLRQSATDNLASRDAIREAGAIQPLVALLDEEGATKSIRQDSAGVLRASAIRHP